MVLELCTTAQISYEQRKDLIRSIRWLDLSLCALICFIFRLRETYATSTAEDASDEDGAGLIVYNGKEGLGIDGVYAATTSTYLEVSRAV